MVLEKVQKLTSAKEPNEELIKSSIQEALQLV